MNTVPVTSAGSVDILHAVALALTQTTGSEISSKFRDVFQNLPSAQNQAEDGQQTSNSKTVLPKKKLSPGDDTTAVSPTPVPSNNVARTNTALTLSLALPKAIGSPQAASPQDASPQAVSPMVAAPQTQAKQPDPTDAHTSESTGSPTPESIKGSQLRQPPAGSAAVLPQTTSLTNVAVRADPIVTAIAAPATNVSSEDSPRTSLPPVEQLINLRFGSAPENAQVPASMPASTAAESSFPVNTANLAFAMQLTQSTTKDPTPSSTEAARPAATLTASNAAPSHDFSKIAILPSDARSSGHSDASPREPRNFEKPESAFNEPVHTKFETTAHRTVSTPAGDPAPATAMNRSATALNQPLAGAAAWMGAATHIDPRPSAILEDQTAPAPPLISTPPHLQLSADAPKTNFNTGILLNLGDGQTAAAVRVVDRAGTVSVSVHAPDQDVRNSLRSNITDLTTQLNAQGVRTEVLKTASAQPAAEGRQQPNSQDHRSPEQHQPSTQNQQQSQQRERRNNNRWLDELAAQADPNSVNSGGKKS